MTKITLPQQLTQSNYSSTLWVVIAKFAELVQKRPDRYQLLTTTGGFTIDTPEHFWNEIPLSIDSTTFATEYLKQVFAKILRIVSDFEHEEFIAQQVGNLISAKKKLRAALSDEEIDILGLDDAFKSYLQ